PFNKVIKFGSVNVNFSTKVKNENNVLSFQRIEQIRPYIPKGLFIEII
ncbi:MAG: hypothetical protein QG635_589, partial [Bacteroidota bacterium]|nr:hypothetical protein [Bacteroidota bacterium]